MFSFLLKTRACICLPVQIFMMYIFIPCKTHWGVVSTVMHKLLSLKTWCTDLSEAQKTVDFNSSILQSLANSDMDVTDEEDCITLVTDLFKVSMFILFWFLTFIWAFPSCVLQISHKGTLLSVLIQMGFCLNVNCSMDFQNI